MPLTLCFLELTSFSKTFVEHENGESAQVSDVELKPILILGQFCGGMHARLCGYPLPPVPLPLFLLPSSSPFPPFLFSFPAGYPERHRIGIPRFISDEEGEGDGITVEENNSIIDEVNCLSVYGREGKGK